MVRSTDIDFRDPYEEIGFATGRIKEGKSYAVNKITANVQYLIVWDYNWEHNDKLVVHTLGELKAVWGIRATQKKVRIAFQPLDKSPQGFEAFLNYIYTLRYVCLVIEEVRIYTIQNRTPKVLIDIVDSGRHYKIGVWATSRRAKGVAVDIPFNATHILAFRQYRPEDIKYLADFMDSQIIEDLKSKPKYWFAYFNGKTGETKLHAPL